MAHVRKQQQRDGLAIGRFLDHYRVSDSILLFEMSQKNNKSSAWVRDSEGTWEILTDGYATAPSARLGEYRRRYLTMIRGHYGASLDWNSLSNEHNKVSKLIPSRSLAGAQGTAVFRAVQSDQGAARKPTRQRQQQGRTSQDSIQAQRGSQRLEQTSLPRRSKRHGHGGFCPPALQPSQARSRRTAAAKTKKTV